MEPKVVEKEIPSKRLELILADGTRVIGDEGKAYAPQTWLVRHILSLMQELEFDYHAALRVSQILSEILRGSPFRLPVKDFLEAAGVEDQLRRLTMTDNDLMFLGVLGAGRKYAESGNEGAPAPGKAHEDGRQET